VNGEPAELASTDGVEVSSSSDRLIVRSSGHTDTALVGKRAGKTLISFRGQVYEVEKATARGGGHAAIGNGEARAPMPGQIVEVLVTVGQVVGAGEKLLVLEAMKMQQPITASLAGRVTKISVGKGDQVVDGQLLAVVAAEEEE